MHDSEQVIALQPAHHGIVVGYHRRGIRVVNEQRFHRRVAQLGERLRQFDHVDDARRLGLKFFVLDGFLVQVEAAAERKLQSAADFLPCADQARQHADGAHRRTAVFGALDAVIHTDRRRPRGRIFARQPHDVLRRNSRPLGHPLRRILLDFFFQLVEAERGARDVVGIVEPLVDNDVHHAERKRHVGPRTDGDVPVSQPRRARLVRIDHHQLRAVAFGLFHERPQVDVIAVDIRAPGDDVARVRELLGLGADLGAINAADTRLAWRGTNRAVEPRCAQAVKEAVVHRAAIQYPQRPAIGVRKNRLAAELVHDVLEARRDGGQRLVPGDALEIAETALACTFGRGALHRIEHAVGRINTVQVLCHLSAQKPARYRMLRVPAQAHSFACALIHGDEYAARVRTVVRTRGVHYLEFPTLCHT